MDEFQTVGSIAHSKGIEVAIGNVTERHPHFNICNWNISWLRSLRILKLL